MQTTKNRSRSSCPRDYKSCNALQPMCDKPRSDHFAFKSSTTWEPQHLAHRQADTSSFQCPSCERETSGKFLKPLSLGSYTCKMGPVIPPHRATGRVKAAQGGRGLTECSVMAAVNNSAAGDGMPQITPQNKLHLTLFPLTSFLTNADLLMNKENVLCGLGAGNQPI